MDCLANTFENNVWNLEHNAEKLQEIWNRIMQGIMSIITSALLVMSLCYHACASLRSMYSLISSTESSLYLNLANP